MTEIEAINEMNKMHPKTCKMVNGRSKGGIDDISNYQTMCKLCNEAKGNKLED